MQIHNETTVSAMNTSEQTFLLRAGEQLYGIVKERFAGNEALLRLKGHEIHVKFEGSLPSEERVLLMVTDMSKELPVVKEIKAAVAEEPASPPPQLQIPRGVKGDLRKAVEILVAKGVPVSKNTLRELAIFFEKSGGTTAEKLETIEALAKKGLELTPLQIQAVHKALHDTSLKNDLTKLLKELSREKPLSFHLPDSGPVLQATGDHPGAAEPGAPLSNIDLLLKALKKEPDFGKIVSMLNGELAGSGTLTERQTEKLAGAVKTAVSMAEGGRELASRRMIAEALEQIRQENKSGNAPAPASSAYSLSEEITALLPQNAKDYIVATVTERMSQLTIDFKNIKRELTRHLNTAEMLIRQNPAQARPVLESVIKLLDQAILKSDIMLYTDMELEKKLLQASSKLAAAKKILANGDAASAQKIVTEVREVLEKIIFKPSDVKVRHFVLEKLLTMEPLEPKAQAAVATESSLQEINQFSSARGIYEKLIRLGLTYEGDRAFALVTKGNPEAASLSLKEALLKLAQDDESSLSQKAEQVVTNLTGQQLLSKNDPANLQSMMFILPFLLKEKAEQVKVFINSKNGKEKIDWENCRLYFLLETEKLGEVGINLTVVDRNLSITIKNDRPDFREKVAPLTEQVKERLEEIGFQVTSIRFSRLSGEEKTDKSPKPAAKPKLPHFTGRGYDFTI